MDVPVRVGRGCKRVAGADDKRQHRMTPRPSRGPGSDSLYDTRCLTLPIHPKEFACFGPSLSMPIMQNEGQGWRCPSVATAASLVSEGARLASMRCGRGDGCD